MAHDRFRRFNTMGRWPNQAIDYDVSLMVRASGRSLFLGGLTGFDRFDLIAGVCFLPPRDDHAVARAARVEPAGPEGSLRVERASRGRGALHRAGSGRLRTRFVSSVMSLDSGGNS